ncbi:glutathione S-transferase domain-containing protein [Xylogone sp. PMI_703]|nr:glutathione S-transferase domain-containing protein [Xylogone sp. PMI_703]
MGSNTTPEIILYTNHGCPWAHRAHIALAELGVPYKEEIIDLDTPRTKEYLAINPRGLVPSIKYNGEIITESAIVAQFLADAHPSHLVKTSTEEGGALQRARINFFVDTYFTKVNSNFYSILKADGAEKDELAEKFVAAIEKEIEPLLKDANPFFGGSSRLTLAEVQTGSFILRLLSAPKYGLFPTNFTSILQSRTPNFYKWATNVVKEKSVNFIYDEEKVATRTKARIDKMKAQAKV